MAKKIYTGVSNLPKNIKEFYVGVNGVPKKVTKGYVGVNGVPKLFWDGSGEDENGWKIVPLFLADSNAQNRYYNKNYILANFDNPSYIRIANQTINIDNYTYKDNDKVVTTGTNEYTYGGNMVTWPYISTGSPSTAIYSPNLSLYNRPNNKEKQMIYIPVKNLKNIIKLFIRYTGTTTSCYINIGIAKFNNSTQQLDYSKIFALSIPNTFSVPLCYQNSTNFSARSSDFSQKPLKSVQSFYDLSNQTILELDFRYLWADVVYSLDDVSINADFLVFGLYNSYGTTIQIKEATAIIGKKEGNDLVSDSGAPALGGAYYPIYPKKPYSHITDRFVSSGKTRVLFGIRRSTDHEYSYDGSGNPQISYYISRNRSSSQYVNYNYNKKIYIGLTKITGTLQFPYLLNENIMGYGSPDKINGAIIFAIPNFTNVYTDYNTVLNSVTVGYWNVGGYVNPDEKGDDYYEQNWDDEHESVTDIHAMEGTYIHSQQDIWSYIVMLGDITQYVLNPRIKGFGGTYKDIQASYDINFVDRTNIIVENFIEDLYNDGLV